MEGTKIFVGGIPSPNASPDQLAELFEKHLVTPIEVVVLPAKGTNQETRCGFVRIADELVTAVCESMNGMTFDGYAAPLVVRPADNQKQGGGGGGGGGGAPAGHGSPRAAAVVPPPASGAYYGGFGQGFERAPSAESAQKAQAKAEGKWLEAAEWMEQEYLSAGEPLEQKVERLRKALITAAVEEHFYEAASLYEALNQIDPQAAALANATAAATAAGQVAAAPQVVAPTNPAAAALARAQSIAARAVGQTQQVAASPMRVAPPSNLAAVPRQPQMQPQMPPQQLSQETYEGSILSFKPEKNFGFIQCPELGCDAFLSSKQLGIFTVGDRVLFNVTYNTQGKPQAQNLRSPGEEGVAEDGWIPEDDGGPVKRQRY